jgi:hypothetical protein
MTAPALRWPRWLWRLERYPISPGQIVALLAATLACSGCAQYQTHTYLYPPSDGIPGASIGTGNYVFPLRNGGGGGR